MRTRKRDSASEKGGYEKKQQPKERRKYIKLNKQGGGDSKKGEASKERGDIKVNHNCYPN